MDEHKKEQDILVKQLRERLDWYTFRAGTDEFNVEEVIAILELLKVLQPLENDYYNSEKGLERFWKYYERREALENAALNRLKEEEDRALAEMLAREEQSLDDLKLAREKDTSENILEFPIKERSFDKETIEEPIISAEIETVSAVIPTDCSETTEISKEANNQEQTLKNVSENDKEAKKKKGKLFFFRRHKGATGSIAAALVVLTVLVSGTAGAYAERDTGFFHWLRKDDSGTEMIISPGLDNETNLIQPVKYDNFEALPDEYSDVLWKIESPLTDLTCQYIEVINFNSYTEIVTYYNNPLNEDHLEIGVTVYDNSVMIEKNKFDNYKYYDEKIIDGILTDLFVKESEDEIEHAICFYDDVRGYSVKGNLVIDELETVISKYSHFVFGNEK